MLVTHDVREAFVFAVRLALDRVCGAPPHVNSNGVTRSAPIVSPSHHVNQTAPYAAGGAMPASETLVVPTLGLTQHARNATAVNVNPSCVR